MCTNYLPNCSKIRLATPGKFYQDFCKIGNRQKACLTKLYRFDCVFLPKTTHKQAQWRGDLIHYFRNLHLFT